MTPKRLAWWLLAHLMQLLLWLTVFFLVVWWLPVFLLAVLGLVLWEWLAAWRERCLERWERGK